jgi:hypothetical protein
MMETYTKRISVIIENWKNLQFHVDQAYVHSDRYVLTPMFLALAKLRDLEVWRAFIVPPPHQPSIMLGLTGEP